MADQLGKQSGGRQDPNFDDAETLFQIAVVLGWTAG